MSLYGPRLIDGRWVLSALQRQNSGFGTFWSWDDLFGASKTMRVFSNIIIYSVNINMWSSIDLDTDIDTGVNTRCTVSIKISTRIEMKSDNGSICTGNIDISNIKMHLDTDIVITTTASLRPGNKAHVPTSRANQLLPHDTLPAR